MTRELPRFAPSPTEAQEVRASIRCTRHGDGWVFGTLLGAFQFQAKVYGEPSRFGINEGRVSKLWIATLPPAGQKHRTLQVYNYDRGLDVNHLREDSPIVPELVAFLEAM